MLRRSDLALLRLLLPAAAVVVSANDPPALAFVVGRGAAVVTVTPLRLAAAAAYLAVVYCFLLRRAVYFLAAGAAAAAAALYGPSVAQIEAAAERAWETAEDLANKLMPKTSTAWGVVGVASAFVFLLLGAAVSLRKPPDEPVGVQATPAAGDAPALRAIERGIPAGGGWGAAARFRPSGSGSV